MIQRGLLTLLLWLLPLTAFAADMTQREWMKQLVAGLGWEFGLPDEPQAEDYIRLLSGERSLRLEIETSHRKTDRLAVKRYTNYGEYSGTGWVSGFRQPTQIHLDFLLLHNSRYRLAVASRLTGTKIELGGRTFVANAGDSFVRHELGMVDLPAGQTEIVITLPPNGAIDYLELTAPSSARIAPLDGWRPEQPIQIADLALTSLQLLNLLELLPSAQGELQVELETVADRSTARVSSARHLGVPSGYSWLQTDNRPARLKVPVRVPKAACYQLLLTASGAEPTRVWVEDYFTRELRFGPALKTLAVGSYCLPQQVIYFELQLPAWAGGDLLELRQYDTSSAALTRLLGLSSEQRLPDRLVVNQLLELMSGMIH